MPDPLPSLAPDYSPRVSWMMAPAKDEMGNGVEGNDDYGMDNQDDSGAGPNTGGGGSGSAGGGGHGGGGGGRSKADTRRGVDLPPSGTEIRAFVNQFEDIAVNPPQDAVLRQHWDTWVKEDVGKHNAQQNRQVGRRRRRQDGVAWRRDLTLENVYVRCVCCRPSLLVCVFRGCLQGGC